MITIAVERAMDVMEEMKPLLLEHWQEIAIDKDRVPLNPQYNIYLEQEAKGELLLVVAREKGKIVAYFVGFLLRGLHYADLLTLRMDIFRIIPEYRAVDSLSRIEEEMLAADLFGKVKEEAKKRGVRRAFFGSKLDHDASRFFEQLGMVEVERYWSAWWGE